MTTRYRGLCRVCVQYGGLPRASLPHHSTLRERRTMDGSNTAYWMSYSCCNGPWVPSHFNECGISVVMDAGAHLGFAGARLMIVHKEDSSLDNLTVRDCIEPRKMERCRLDLKDPLLLFAHRGKLARNRNEIWRSDRGSSVTSPPVSICTITMEVQPVKPHLVQLVLAPPEITHEHPWRIAYDRTYPCTASPIHAMLRCSHSFLDKDMSGRLRASTFSLTAMHTIRIIPNTTHRRTVPGLPASVLRYIFDHVVTKGNTGWRDTLLNVALVQKSWSPVALDCFFGKLGHRPCTQYFASGDLVKVVRSLKVQPEKAPLIGRFDDLDFMLPRKSEDGLRAYKAAIREILTQTFGGLTTLTISKSSFQDARDAIQGLKAVQLLDVHSSPLLHDGREIGVIDIQRVIREWKHLRNLRITNWSDSGVPGYSRELHEPPETEALRVDHYLETLCLYEGNLTGEELLNFISLATPTPIPALYALDLQKIKGPSNRDLFHFLSDVSRSVSHITLVSCEFPRASPNEEHAFEAVLPRMSNLTLVGIQGSLMTALAIARKGDGPSYTPSPEVIARQAGKEWPGATWKTKINIMHVEPGSIQSTITLAEALEATHWEAVVFGDPMTTWISQEDKVRATEVATRRGISLLGLR